MYRYLCTRNLLELFILGNLVERKLHTQMITKFADQKARKELAFTRGSTYARAGPVYI